MTDLQFPFAHTIAPDSYEFLADEVSPEEWEKKWDDMYRLSQVRWHNDPYAGANYYVLFLDPSNKTLDNIIDADSLYELYYTKFYNEEIHLISPKKK